MRKFILQKCSLTGEKKMAFYLQIISSPNLENIPLTNSYLVS